MQTTERIRPVGWATETARRLPSVLLSLFIVVAGVDALIATQPQFVRSLRDDWQQWVAAGIAAPWATLLAGTATVLCAAIAASLVIVVVRAVSDAPYLSLASALVAGCSFAISRMTLELPIPLPVPLFACVSAVLLLGGGAFFQTRSVLLNTIGMFLTSLPLALLGVGYTSGRTSTGSAYDVDHAAQLLLATLLLASIGTLLIAVAARKLGALGGAAAMGAPTAEQLAKLVQRVRAGEQRAAEAEHRLQFSMQQGDVGSRADDALEISGLRRSRWALLAAWSLLTLVAAGGAFAFFGSYLPLQRQFVTQKKLNHELTRQHAVALAKLRAGLEQQLRAATTQAVPAAAVVEAPAAPAAASDAPKQAARRLDPTNTSLPKHAAVRAADKPARAAEAAPKATPAPTTRGPVAREDDPLEGLDP